MPEITNDTSSKIKPIETAYKGYRFRSRLEARWAIYLDAIKVKWIYEPEGYDLGGEFGYYLPDFWLPQFECHLEVKPYYLNEYANLCREFAIKITPITLVCGSPWEYCGIWFGWDLTDSGGGAGEFDAVIIRTPYIILNNARKDRTYHITSIFANAPRTIIDMIQLNDAFEKRGLKKFDTWPDLIEYMYDICEEETTYAKQARFEHGESP